MTLQNLLIKNRVDSNRHMSVSGFKLGCVLALAGFLLIVFSITAASSGAFDRALWELILASEPTNDFFNPPKLLITWAAFGIWMLVAGSFMVVRREQELPVVDGAALAVMAVAVLVMALYTTFHLSLMSFPEWVWREDGFFEYLTVGILLFASICVFAALRRGYSTFNRMSRVLLYGFGVLLFLAVMEEISWGQRILGVETPETLKAVNAQEEINVHNLFVGYNEIIRMVLALVVSSAFLVCSMQPQWLRRLGLSAISPDRRYVYFSIVLIPAHIYDEMFEQVLSFLILYYAVDLALRTFGVRLWQGYSDLPESSSFPAE